MISPNSAAVSCVEAILSCCGSTPATAATTIALNHTRLAALNIVIIYMRAWI